MRLTLVISSLRRGGAERIMSTLAGAWAEQGKEVTLLTLDDGGELAYPVHASVKLHNLRLASVSSNPVEGLLRNIRRIRALRRAIRESQPDVVISCMDSVNVLTLLATRLRGQVVVISEQTDPALYNIGRTWNSLRRLVYPFANVLVCPVNASLARFQEMTRVRGCVIPNFIDVPAEVAKVREEPDTHMLVAMGRLVPQKGFDLLLQAFSRIAGRHPLWSLTILGEGPLKAELQAQAESLHLKDRVHFAGIVADPFPVLRAAGLFVFSSRFEGFGLALVEAMACGVPVVSFDCPAGPSDIIRDGVDGILVPPEDVDALALALDRLMGDDQERGRLARRAPEVLQRFSRERILGLWEQLFDKLSSTTNASHWNSNN